MKQLSCFLLFLIIFFFVFISPAASSATNDQVKDVKHGKVNLPLYSVDHIEINNSLNELMGYLEECEEEDGECMKRRVVAEAHLDYIYTQHHNHP